MDKDVAFDLLSTKPPGTFLIRFSTNPEHLGFVISMVDHKKTVVHIRIKYQPGSPQPYSMTGSPLYPFAPWLSILRLLET
jgi:hypothetical protein